MSSPFSVFRKNQRAWMAALVLVAIVSFILLPTLSTMTDPTGTANPTTAVTWKGGSMSFDEVRSLTNSYMNSHQFLERLVVEVVQAGGTPTIPGYLANSGSPSTGLIRPNSAEEVVASRLFAEKARQHGVNISDETIDIYIRELTNGRITQARFVELMRETAGPDLNRFQLYQFIKDNIAQQMLLQMEMSGNGVNGMALSTPSKNWEGFRRFEQRATIEAYPYFVETFVTQVTGEPSDRELREIYEAGKDKAPTKTSAEFGFANRYSADFEFVSSSLDKLIEEEAPKITEEQIKNYYEQRLLMGEFKVEDKPATLEPTTPDATTETSTPAATPPSEPATDAAAPAAPVTETPAASETPAVEAPAVEAPAVETPAVETPAVETPAVETPSAPATSDGSSNSPVRASTRLVAFQEPSVGETTAPAATEALETAAAVTTEASTTEATTTTTETPTQTPPTTTEEAVLVPTSDAAAVPPTNVAPAAPPAPPMRTQTLDEVRDQIRRTLATEPATKRQIATFENIAKAMADYQQEMQYYLDAQENKFDDKAVKPADLDLEKLAKDNGLEYGRTGMMDIVQSRETDLGMSMLQNQAQLSMQPFWRVMFSQNIRKFEPYNFNAMLRNIRFLAWKVEEKEPYIPTFEQARPRVVDAWKLVKARELAAAKAEELSSKMATSEGWDKVLSPNEQALLLRPTSFTWLQRPMFGMDQLTTSFIDGIDSVTNDFMKQIFSAPLGSYVVLPSENRDRYFVIKVVDRAPKDEELLTKFATNPMNPYVQELERIEFTSMYYKWLENYQNEIELNTSSLARN
jgi:hypothetical protein